MLHLQFRNEHQYSKNLSEDSSKDYLNLRKRIIKFEIQILTFLNSVKFLLNLSSSLNLISFLNLRCIKKDSPQLDFIQFLKINSLMAKIIQNNSP